MLIDWGNIARPLCLDSSWPLARFFRSGYSFLFLGDPLWNEGGSYDLQPNNVRHTFLWLAFTQKGGGKVTVRFLGFMAGFEEKGVLVSVTTLGKRDSSYYV